MLLLLFDDDVVDAAAAVVIPASRNENITTYTHLKTGSFKTYVHSNRVSA